MRFYLFPNGGIAERKGLRQNAAGAHVGMDWNLVD